ncbi:MAG: hypothetical protein FD167_192 [bacterium]|nr:MAG: hypothetical protein FD167_192 [bacterium]
MNTLDNNIVDFYNQQVFPKLTIALVYDKVNFAIRRGRHWRGRCPIHNGDNPTAFSVNIDTLAWTCFSHCGSGSVLAFVNGGIEPKGKEFVDVVYQLAELVNLDRPDKKPRSYKGSNSTKKRQTLQPYSCQKPLSSIAQKPSVKQTHKMDLVKILDVYQEALPSSLGEEYLLRRKISLELAQKYGIGYAAPGTWLHKTRDWKWGRLVFPHTNPEGEIVNLYGRAVGSVEKVPKEMRHDHLPGAKGYFNGQIMKEADHVFICEGPFDAVSLVAASYLNAVAIFGVNGWRWDWSRNISKLIFALDADEAGNKWKELAREACLRGKQVCFLPPESYGSKKDVNEAWVAGTLNVEL